MSYRSKFRCQWSFKTKILQVPAFCSFHQVLEHIKGNRLSKFQYTKHESLKIAKLERRYFCLNNHILKANISRKKKNKIINTEHSGLQFIFLSFLSNQTAQIKRARKKGKTQKRKKLTKQQLCHQNTRHQTKNNGQTLHLLLSNSTMNKKDHSQLYLLTSTTPILHNIHYQFHIFLHFPSKQTKSKTLKKKKKDKLTFFIQWPTNRSLT